MPDTLTNNSLSSQFANNLYFGFLGYSEPELYKLPENFALSKEDLLAFFDVLIRDNPSWAISLGDPDRHKKVAGLLHEIGEGRIKETAAVPSILLDDLQKAASQDAVEREFGKRLIHNNLQREIERLKTIYAASQKPQQPLGEEQKAAVEEAQNIVNESRVAAENKRIDEIPERRAYPLKASPQEQEKT